MEEPDPKRDVSPRRYTLQYNRRLVLASGSAVLGGLAAAQAWPVRSAAVNDDRFMTLSRLLIPHRLDAEVGRRIAAALKIDRPPLSDHIDALLTLAHEKSAVVAEDFFPFAADDVKASALRIISAWYLGVVDDAPGAKIVAYELALMFKPTSDVMTIPTYSISRPNGWGATAPPLSAMPIF